MAEKRPLRVCDVCFTIDDHPRALHLFAPGDAPVVPGSGIATVARLDFPVDVIDAAIAELSDPASACRHMDCCVQAGCPDEDRICEKVLAAAKADGSTGNALVKKLTTPAVGKVGAALNQARLDRAEA